MTCRATVHLFHHSMKIHLVGLLVCMLACTGQAYKPSLARLIVLSAVMMDHTHITVEAGNVDSFPIISQFKSAVQAIGGDLEGAKRTQENFVDGCPVVSQVKAAVVAGTEGHEAARLQQEKFGKLMLDTIDGIPVAGHIKGAIHYAMGDNEMGEKCMVDATRGGVNLVAGAAGFMVGGPVGAGAATVLAGAAYDGIATGALTLAHGKVTPYGIVSAGMNLAEQAKTGRVDIGDAFDTAMGPVMEFAGTAVPLIKAKFPVRARSIAMDELSKLKAANRAPLIEKPSVLFEPKRWTDVERNMPLTLESSLRKALQVDEKIGFFKQFTPTEYKTRFHLEAKMNDYFSGDKSIFENYKKVNSELANRYLTDPTYTRKLFLKEIDRNLKRYENGINEKMVVEGPIRVKGLSKNEQVTGQSFNKWSVEDLGKPDNAPAGSYFDHRLHRVQADLNYARQAENFKDPNFILKSRMKTLNGDPPDRLVKVRGRTVAKDLLEAGKDCERCGEHAAVEHLNGKTPYYRDEGDPGVGSSHQVGGDDVVHADPDGRLMNFDTIEHSVSSAIDEKNPSRVIAKATCVDCLRTFAEQPDKVKYIPSNIIDKKVTNLESLPIDGRRPEGGPTRIQDNFDQIYNDLPGTAQQKEAAMAAYARMNDYLEAPLKFDNTANEVMKKRLKQSGVLEFDKLKKEMLDAELKEMKDTDIPRSKIEEDVERRILAMKNAVHGTETNAPTRLFNLERIRQELMEMERQRPENKDLSRSELERKVASDMDSIKRVIPEADTNKFNYDKIKKYMLDTERSKPENHGLSKPELEDRVAGRINMIRDAIPETDTKALSKQLKNDYYFSSGDGFKTSVTMVDAVTENAHSVTVSAAAREAMIRNAAKKTDVLEGQGAFQSFRNVQQKLAVDFAKGKLTEEQFTEALKTNQRRYDTAITEKVGQYSHAFYNDKYVPVGEMPYPRFGKWTREDILTVKKGQTELVPAHTIPKANSLYNPTHRLNYVSGLTAHAARRTGGLVGGQWATRSDYDDYHGPHGYHTDSGHGMHKDTEQHGHP